MNLTQMNKTQMPINTNPAVSLPLIDKLSGVVDLKDPQLAGLAYSGMIDWIDDKASGVIRLPPNKHYSLGVKIPYPDKDGVLSKKPNFFILQLAHPKKVKLQARFEYNPAYMNEAAEEYIGVQLQELFGVTFYDFLFHARFTRLDICRDVECDIGHYMIKAKWKKVSQCFFGSSGKLETINLGKASSNQITAYDKASQLFGPDTDCQRTRIEAKCRVSLTPNQLKTLLNPLKVVEIYSLKCSNPPYGIAHWRAFTDSCRLRGVSGALLYQPADCRAKLKKAISGQPVSWWSISDDDWPKLLKEALIKAGLNKIPTYALPLSCHSECKAAA